MKKETAKEDQEPAEDFQSVGTYRPNSLTTDDTESEEAEEAADTDDSEKSPIKLLKLRLKMQKRKKMPMNPRILKRLWTLHLNLKNKRYRSQ